MTTQRDILKAVEGLPQALLEQVKDFIAHLKEKKGAQKASLSGKALAKRQVAAIKNGPVRISAKVSRGEITTKSCMGVAGDFCGYRVPR